MSSHNININMNQQTELYKKWTPAQRLKAASQLYFFAKETIRTREQKLHPHLSPKELEKKVRSFFS